MMEVLLSMPMFSKPGCWLSTDALGDTCAVASSSGVLLVKLDEIARASSGGTASVAAIAASKHLQFQHPRVVGQTFDFLQFHPRRGRRQILASCAGTSVVLWDAEAGKATHLLREIEDGMTTDCAWSLLDGNIVASCYSSPTLKMWDMRDSRRACMRLSTLSLHSTDHQVKWCHNDPRIVATVHDQSISVWDLRKISKPLRQCPFSMTRRLALSAHTSTISGLDWTWGRNTADLVTCSTDRSVKLWSFEPSQKAVKPAPSPEVVQKTAITEHTNMLHRYTRVKTTPWRSDGILTAVEQSSKIILWQRVGRKLKEVDSWQGTGAAPVTGLEWRFAPLQDEVCLEYDESRSRQLVAWSADDMRLRILTTKWDKPPRHKGLSVAKAPSLLPPKVPSSVDKSISSVSSASARNPLNAKNAPIATNSANLRPPVLKTHRTPQKRRTRRANPSDEFLPCPRLSSVSFDASGRMAIFANYAHVGPSLQSETSNESTMPHVTVVWPDTLAQFLSKSTDIKTKLMDELSLHNTRNTDSSGSDNNHDESGLAALTREIPPLLGPASLTDLRLLAPAASALQIAQKLHARIHRQLQTRDFDSEFEAAFSDFKFPKRSVRHATPPIVPIAREAETSRERSLRKLLRPDLPSPLFDALALSDGNDDEEEEDLDEEDDNDSSVSSVYLSSESDSDSDTSSSLTLPGSFTLHLDEADNAEVVHVRSDTAPVIPFVLLTPAQLLRELHCVPPRLCRSLSFHVDRQSDETLLSIASTYGYSAHCVRSEAERRLLETVAHGELCARRCEQEKRRGVARLFRAAAFVVACCPCVPSKWHETPLGAAAMCAVLREMLRCDAVAVVPFVLQMICHCFGDKAVKEMARISRISDFAWWHLVSHVADWLARNRLSLLSAQVRKLSALFDCQGCVQHCVVRPPLPPPRTPISETPPLTHISDRIKLSKETETRCLICRHVRSDCVVRCHRCGHTAHLRCLAALEHMDSECRVKLGCRHHRLLEQSPPEDTPETQSEHVAVPPLSID